MPDTGVGVKAVTRVQVILRVRTRNSIGGTNRASEGRHLWREDVQGALIQVLCLRLGHETWYRVRQRVRWVE